ncbi:hypothetical protein OJF2_36470 [Aquisphaera giovannonii]|uniref:Uncharacterized protein n=1 Tax=Aquisphaera giovannonii TaxID=406548 RepID=A0A5B9W3D8_9BACT|nr:hypothetical protein [Aquisphaera giovannonii]QEH35102.1 hypothetical protein OJF2_36470 [Aquisphaera giovannonii]
MTKPCVFPFSRNVPTMAPWPLMPWAVAARAGGTSSVVNSLPIFTKPWTFEPRPAKSPASLIPKARAWNAPGALAGERSAPSSWNPVIPMGWPAA